VRGKDVFVPLSQLIGGPDMAGHGWRMLVECLSVGRAITLPSNTTGGAKAGAIATGAYARIRKQFGMAIGRFEGVEEALARIGGYTYAMSALSLATAAAVDRGDVRPELRRTPVRAARRGVPTPATARAQYAADRRAVRSGRPRSTGVRSGRHARHQPARAARRRGAALRKPPAGG